MNPAIAKNQPKENHHTNLWTKDFVCLNLSFFLVFSNIAFLYLYPLFLAAGGTDRHTIGWVMGLFSVATVLSRPLMGKVAAWKGEYWLIPRGIITIFLVSLGYHLIATFGPGMVLIRIIHGIGFSAFISGSFSLVAKAFPPAKRAEAFGIVGAFIMGAIALAPFAGEFLIGVYGFHALFAASALSALFAFFASLVAIPVPFAPDKGNGPVRIRFLPILRDRSFIIVLASTLIFAHCQSTVANFLALIADSKGVSSGRFFFASFFIAILALLFMARLIDKYGKRSFLRLSYPFLAFGILLVPATIEDVLFFIPAITYGIGMGLLFPAHNALAADHGTKAQKPAVMSIFTAVYDTGFVTGAVVSGWLAHVIGLDCLFFVSGALSLLGLFTILLAPVKKG
jgi:MFS family permease